MMAVWDDHELTNDAWAGGAGNHNENEGDWPTRRAAAYKAYLEWLPIRELSTGAIHLYRSFRFGSLADLVMLDTRGLRDQQVKGDDLAGLADPRRSLLGAAQEAWLFDQLRTSQRDGTTWRLLGQQVLFSRVAYIGRPVPLADVWDGYQAARERVLEFLATEKIRDLAILAGDLHSSWAFDVPRNPWDGYAARTGDGSVAIEVVTPAVSSPPLFADPLIRQNAPALRFALPHLKYLEGESRGYLLVDLTPERMTAEWYYTPTVLERSTLETRAAGFVSERGSSRLAPA
jgi:alkaline phosphatase D